jgi:c-di-GMP-binding flagellar brake protein YcgR
MLFGQIKNTRESNSEEDLKRKVERLQHLLAEKEELIISQQILKLEPIEEATPMDERSSRDSSTSETEVEATDKFLVNSKTEILYILRSMIRSKSLTTLTFGKDIILTTIIGVNLKRREIIFDCGANEDANLRAIKSHRLSASSLLHQVPIHFMCTKLERIQFEGGGALITKFPEGIRRIQKREQFRTDIPMSIQLKCKLPTPEGDFAETLVKNISQGGMLVIDQCNKVPFEIGIEYQGGLINLDPFGVAKVNLQVRSVSQITQRGDATKCQRAGLEFTKSTEKRSLTMIQQYVMKIQSEGLKE